LKSLYKRKGFDFFIELKKQEYQNQKKIYDLEKSLGFKIPPLYRVFMAKYEIGPIGLCIDKFGGSSGREFNYPIASFQNKPKEKLTLFDFFEDFDTILEHWVNKGYYDDNMYSWKLLYVGSNGIPNGGIYVGYGGENNDSIYSIDWNWAFEKGFVLPNSYNKQDKFVKFISDNIHSFVNSLSYDYTQIV